MNKSAKKLKKNTSLFSQMKKLIEKKDSPYEKILSNRQKRKLDKIKKKNFRRETKPYVWVIDKYMYNYLSSIEKSWENNKPQRYRYRKHNFKRALLFFDKLKRSY
jgi:hypothetical protein